MLLTHFPPSRPRARVCIPLTLPKCAKEEDASASSGQRELLLIQAQDLRLGVDRAGPRVRRLAVAPCVVPSQASPEHLLHDQNRAFNGEEAGCTTRIALSPGKTRSTVCDRCPPGDSVAVWLCKRRRFRLGTAVWPCRRSEIGPKGRVGSCEMPISWHPASEIRARPPPAAY